uniref:Uncharacterized protein n=1 Tax=Romanomermis culicivorax TaxID=13658 RepID=A0A915IKH7_ROMCU
MKLIIMQQEDAKETSGRGIFDDQRKEPLSEDEMSEPVDASQQQREEADNTPLNTPNGRGSGTALQPCFTFGTDDLVAHKTSKC